MAIQFNLLPWREELRAKREKSNKIILGVAVVIGLLISGGYYGYKSLILDDYDKALTLIKRKNAQLDKKIKKKKELDALKIELNNQIDSIESLQDDRSSVTHMVEELSLANDKKTFLKSFSLSNGKVNISGVAENDSAISRFMKRLNASSWYQEPALSGIKVERSLGGEVKTFRVNSHLLLPGTDKKEK